ncbi:MAG: SulP family inorganic anion transporter [Acidobacteriota bacterium]
MSQATSTSELTQMRQYFRQDFLASIVVFLVALPLCMGIAIASGVPPAAGLITGIIGGLVVALFAGAPLQVSGPAAGLSVIVWELVQEHGIATLGVIVMIAGAAQLLAGLAKMGQWFRAVSPAVIHGMLAGIGVLIFASQFHVMVDDKPRGSGLANLLSIPEAIVKGITPSSDSVHFQAAMIGLVTLATIILWKPLVPGKLKVVPAPLVAVIVGTIAAIVSGVNIARVAVPANLADAVRLPTIEQLSTLNWTLVTAGLALAFVASAETLLCATAVDKMHDGPRTKYDKELTAQGLGNLTCGFLGALPMTGVIVRSSANVEAGGKTRASAFMHGIWLLVFVAALPFILQRIPVAALAAILVFTGYKLVNIAAIRQLASYGRGEVFIYVATLATIVSVDLLSGVVLGIVLSLAKLLYTVSHLDIETRERENGSTLDLFLNGSATVLRLPRLARHLEAVPANTEVHVHLEGLDYIDHACLELLANWEKQHELTGGKLFVDWDGLQARFRERPSQRLRAAA